MKEQILVKHRKGGKTEYDFLPRGEKKWKPITLAEAKREMNRGVWQETVVGLKTGDNKWFIYYKL